MDAFSVKIKISYPFILLSLFLISSCISGNLSQDDEKKISKEIVSIKNKYQKSDWEDKIRLIKNIGEYKNSKSHDIVLQFLLEALSREPHSRVKIEVLKELEYFNDVKIIPTVSETADDNPDKNVKWHAYSLLGKLGHIQDKQIFISGIKNTDWLVREAALIAMLKASTEDEQKNLKSYIISGLKSHRISTVISTMESIKIQDREIFDILKKMIFQKNTPLEILRGALKGINGYSLDSETEEKLNDLLLHWDSTVRILSLRALKKNQLLQQI